MSAQLKTFCSVEEYLAVERESTARHEYIAGKVYAMAGGSEQHNLIMGNVYASLHAQLRRRQCTIYPSDMKVAILSVPRYTYPDISVVCGEAQFSDTKRDTLLNPTILIEVLSPSTQKQDRGPKFTQYWTLPSLREYILIDQESHRLERYARHPEKPGIFLFTVYTAVDDEVFLDAISCTLLLTDVYEKVMFESEDPEAD
jgi:Uma2 family endonuclease